MFTSNMTTSGQSLTAQSMRDRAATERFRQYRKENIAYYDAHDDIQQKLVKTMFCSPEKFNETILDAIKAYKEETDNSKISRFFGRKRADALQRSFIENQPTKIKTLAETLQEGAFLKDTIFRKIISSYLLPEEQKSLTNILKITKRTPEEFIRKSIGMLAEYYKPKEMKHLL